MEKAFDETPDEYAARHGIHRASVYRAMKDGRLAHRRVAGRAVVFESEGEAIRWEADRRRRQKQRDQRLEREIARTALPATQPPATPHTRPARPYRIGGGMNLKDYRRQVGA